MDAKLLKNLGKTAINDSNNGWRDVILLFTASGLYDFDWHI